MATAPKPAKTATKAKKAPAQPKAGKKEAAQPKKRGRPSTFDQAIADEIAERLSKGEPLEQICRDERMPPVRTVNHWREASPQFLADIARARDMGYDALASECLSIADETSNDTLYTENGERPNTEWIARSKLRIETRLKLLAKWDPKRYGDKLDLNHGGQPENPLTVLLGEIATRGGRLPVKPQE